MVKLPMPAGLLLEAAIAGGVSDQHLLDVLQKKDLQALQHIGKEDSSWAYLFQFSEENWDTITQAVKDGYTFKFITIRGLQNFMQTRFSFMEDKDFRVEDQLIQLHLLDSQIKVLRSRVPVQWKFVEQSDPNWNYRAVLAHQYKEIKS